MLLLLFGCLVVLFCASGFGFTCILTVGLWLDVGLFGLVFVGFMQCSFGFIVACRLMFRFGFVARWWFGFCSLCLLLVDFGWFWCLCMLYLLCAVLGGLLWLCV